MNQHFVLKSVVLLFLMDINLNEVNSGRILIWPLSMVYNSRIHTISKMGEILNTHGHQVTLLVPDVYKARTKYNVHNIMTYSFTKERTFEINEDELDGIVHGPLNEFSWARVKLKMLQYDCDALLGNTALIQKLKDDKFDVFITDSLNDPCYTALAEILDLPLIIYSNLGFDRNPWVFSPIQLGSAPNVYVHIGPRPPTFYKRLMEMVDVWFVYFFHMQWYMIPMVHEISKQYNYNISAPTTEVTCSRISLLFINTLFPIDFPKAHKPHVKFIGGFYAEKPISLPTDLQRFVAGSGNHGTIVVSFGTVHVKMVQEFAINVLVDVFSHLKERVIWGDTIRNISGLSSNVLHKSWIPQNDLLGNSRTKLFITHCGQSATQETILHGVPVIALPVACDQQRNAERLCEQLGMGIILDVHRLTSKELEAAILEVINNPEYKKNARIASGLMKDLPMATKDVLTYWVDYVIKYNGAKHLTQEYIDTCNMSIFRYFQLDVIGLITCTLLAMVVVCVLICKMLVHSLWYNTRKHKHE